MLQICKVMTYQLTQANHTKRLYIASKQHYKLWVNTGRPRDTDNAVLRSYKDAKSKLRRAQRQQSEKVYFQKFEELDRAASGDHRRFWKLLRNRNKNDTVQIQSLQVGNQTVKDDNVVEGFAEHYRGVFDFHYTEPCTELVHTIRAYVQNAECNNNNNYLSQISELEIHKACKHLKRGKAA